MKKTKPTKTTNFPEAVLALPIVAGRIKKTQLSEETTLTDAAFLRILLKVKNGNFSQRFPTDQNGIKRSICDTLNEIIDFNERMVIEFKKAGKSIGKQDKFINKVALDGSRGSCSSSADSVNTLISDLVHPTIEIAHVISSVAKENLSQEMPLSFEGNPLKDKFLRITKEVNGMVKQLNSLSSKGTRVVREVGTEGKLGGQTQVKGVDGTWKDVTDSVNIMASNLTSQVRGIAKVVRSVVEGNGKQKLSIKTKGEAAQLVDTINEMITTLATFSAQVTTMTREVGAEAKLGGQANVPGAFGTGKNLTENVNQLAENLSTQVRAAEVASAKSQQEVLKNLNEKLEQKAILLASQKEEVELKNQEVEVARKALEEKADQLSLTSKYKSEFLANMSHELRTPLNSLQILANELIANRDGNLSVKQIEFAKTINSCGEDLIQLINDILDLSKIESGYISIDYNPITFAEISRFVEATFNPISEAKNLRFNVSMDAALPEMMETDAQRLNQILKNLLSNSFKFTEKGEVHLRIYKAHNDGKTKNTSINNAEAVVAFEISDTGIGISKEKQNIIFEAFQQAEGSTIHKYGGTGLGLSISRGLSDLLGGSIELESDTNVGSKFTLLLPLKFIHVSQVEDEIGTEELIVANKGESKLKSLPSSNFNRSDINLFFVDEVGDDRTNINPDDKILLIAEDNLTFAKIMLDQAHLHGIKAIVTTKGNDVIDFINQFHPHAIIIDLNMPDMNGWKILDRLKTDFTLRHIPVYIISEEDERNKALKRGARNFLLKPVKNESLSYLFNDIHDFKNKKIKNLLVVNDNERDLNRILQAVQSSDIQVISANTAKEAAAHMMERSFDCIILDLVLPDADGLDIISDLENTITGQETAIIIHSAGEVNKTQIAKLNRFIHRIITKSAASLDELVDQTALFMHRCHKDLPDVMRERIESFYLREDILSGKKVLIVDDDVRNLFALTTVLERFGLDVIVAESGQEAIDVLTKEKAIEIVLMDIVMPEMDGYETMKNIRKNDKHKDLTIIAVTAKAMKGDRQRCIESGASDYITKPVNVEQLSSLMREWLK